MAAADFANEAAHLLLNGYSETAPPASGPADDAEAVWWDPNLPRISVGAGPQMWRYQPPLPGPWALDDVSKLPALEQIADQLVQTYQTELERLADMLIDAGPVPA